MRRRVVLSGALSPSMNTRNLTPTAPTLDAGLGLFAALTTNDPKSIEIADLRAALDDIRKELEKRNLLLIRSKEALSTLGDRLSTSQSTIKQHGAIQCRLEAELDDARTTLKDNTLAHAATIDGLQEHLTNVRTQCARDTTTARESFAQQEHEWTSRLAAADATNVELQEQLRTVQSAATTREASLKASFNEELSQAQENIENFVEDLSKSDMQLAAAHHLAQERLEELNCVKERFLCEEQQRKDLAARVSTTEQEVIDRLRQKQIEVEALQLKVTSQQKYLRLSKKGKRSSSSSNSNSSSNNNNSSNSSTITCSNENKENSAPVKKAHKSNNGLSRSRRTPSKEEQLMYILHTTTTPRSGGGSKKNSRSSSGGKKGKKIVRKRKGGLKSRRSLGAMR